MEGHCLAEYGGMYYMSGNNEEKTQMEQLWE